MKDRIKVNSEVLDRWASQLGEVSSALDDALSILNDLDTSGEWWGKVGNLSSLSLMLAGQTVSLGDARGAVKSLSSALRTYTGETRQLSANLQKTGAAFGAAVSAMDRTMDGLSNGREAVWHTITGGIPGHVIDHVIPRPVPITPPDLLKRLWKKRLEERIQHITNNPDILKMLRENYVPGGTVENPDMYLVNYLHYPSDPSEWTQTMRDTYEKTRDGAKIIQNSDGSTTYVIDDTYIFATTGGLASTLAFTSKFTEFGYSRDWTDENGAYHKRELADKVEIIGYKGKQKIVEQPSIWNSEKNGYYKDGKKIAVKDTDEGAKESSRKRTIAEVSAGGSASKSLVHGEQKKTYKYGETEVSGDVGYGEAHWNVKGGLYRTEVKADGTTKRVFEPGVSAEVGTSFGLAKGSAKGKFGNEYVDVHGEVEGSVLSGEAKAEGQLGIVDGKFAARGKASAEFNAVSVGGKVGVNVVGIEGNVGANVKVGIGAHADVGYYDGVVKVDIGASLGSGFDVNFELNVGGAIDNAVSGLKEVGKSISKGVSKGLAKLKFW